MSVREAIAGTGSGRMPRTGAAGDAVLVGSGIAWIALLVLSVRIGGVGHGAHGAHTETAGYGAAATLDAWTPVWIGTWLLMVAAMMWPLAVPAANRVARAAYPGWRWILAATTVVTSTLLWVALGLAAASVAQVAAVPAGSTWWQLAFLFVAAAAWWSMRRSRLLWRCVKLPPIAPAGVRGLRSAARVGIVTWRRCAVLCGPLMLAMVVGHNLVVVVAASASVWWEARHPRAWRDPVPLALIVVAGLGVLAGEVLAS